MEEGQQDAQPGLLEYPNHHFSDEEEESLNDFSSSADTEPTSSVYNEANSASASTNSNPDMVTGHPISQLYCQTGPGSCSLAAFPSTTSNFRNARMADDRTREASRPTNNYDDDRKTKLPVFIGKKTYVEEIAGRRKKTGEEGLEEFCQEYQRFVKHSKLRQICKMVNVPGMVNSMLCRARFDATMTRLREGYRLYYFDDDGDVEP